MKSGSLCALLWRLLSWCHPRGIVLRARHIPGHLNVIADKLSRHNQVIQTEWSLSQQVFNLLSSRWAQPQVDLFATRFNHKLPQFVSPVPDPTAWAVDALSLPWGNLDVYAFPPVSLIPPGGGQNDRSGLSEDDSHYYYYYYVFILSTISPYTTGLKALFNQSDCTGTAPTHK